MTICQKYCSVVSRTSFSDWLRCRRLTSTFMFDNLLALIICPPVKRGIVAVTPPITPFFSIEIFSPGIISISSNPLSDINPPPEALNVGKYWVKAFWRTCCEAERSLLAFLIQTLFERASRIHSSNVYVCWASAGIIPAQPIKNRKICFVKFIYVLLIIVDIVFIVFIVFQDLLLAVVFGSYL